MSENDNAGRTRPGHPGGTDFVIWKISGCDRSGDLPSKERPPTAELLTYGIAITNASGQRQKTRFEEMPGPIRMEPHGCGQMIIPLRNRNHHLEFEEKRADEAEQWARTAEKARQEAIRRRVKRMGDEIDGIARSIARLRRPRRYPAACLLQPILSRARELVKRLSMDLSGIDPRTRRRIARIRRWELNPEPSRQRAIQRFMRRETHDAGQFYRIADRPLTPEQLEAVLTCEDATLIHAGAGSGKTSVIAAKVQYLIQRAGRHPSEILLMAFNKNAAEEMGKRVNDTKDPDPVRVQTFHALGNKILCESEEEKPVLAPWGKGDDNRELEELIKGIIRDMSMQKECAELLRTYFTEWYAPVKSVWEFTSREQYDEYIRGPELRTLQGEKVKSREELIIANHLYMQGIDYEYEPPYEHNASYNPDFRLRQSGAYIEHFGISLKPGGGGARWTTAPWIGRDKYLRGMEWKRSIHRRHRTTLIETYSLDHDHGLLTRRLDERIAGMERPRPRSGEEMFEILNKKERIDPFTRTAAKFLKQYKGCGATISQLREKARDGRDRAFLDIFQEILKRYQQELGKEIDFEDMIIRAAEHVENGKFRNPWKHLLVDEFQDISAGSARLLKALKNQRDDARIFAVGDDWQSINRYAGADIRFMMDFGKTFGGRLGGKTTIARTIDLKRTFRNAEGIALPAREFIQKNPNQIKKEIIPAAIGGKSSIRILRHSNEDEALKKAIDRIVEEDHGARTILVLGRYNKSKPRKLKTIQTEYKNLGIKFMTVHKSKGLEADHVVILRVDKDGFDADYLGFPSQILQTENDPLMDLVRPPDDFPDAEERRVMYTALTRARRSVTILAGVYDASDFARELAKGGAEVIKVR